jgi:DNA-binding NtrC family response regulator
MAKRMIEGQMVEVPDANTEAVVKTIAPKAEPEAKPEQSKAKEKAPKAKENHKPTTPESERELAEASKELARICKQIRAAEALVPKRNELINKMHKLGASPKEINGTTGISVPRLRQLFTK